MAGLPHGAPVPRWVDPGKLRDIAVPTLLIHGRDDRVVPFENSLFLLANIPDSRLVVLNRCGHWAVIKHAEEFNQLVIDFVRGNTQSEADRAAARRASRSPCGLSDPPARPARSSPRPVSRRPDSPRSRRSPVRRSERQLQRTTAPRTADRTFGGAVRGHSGTAARATEYRTAR
ncbi:alpha/beta fold hydrolase [Streptomyces anulatus]|uniref:alpha/beta fold hydrolase n=1 Tax=Streptomyces anulatus TaxID=1892 RepID=UPI003818BACE